MMTLRPDSLLRRLVIIVVLFTAIILSSHAQGTRVDFSTIPKSGTILVNAHMDDDLIWMLPFWNITEKFICGAMPQTPSYRTIISQSQTYMNNNGYNISYEPNWYTPWTDVTEYEYMGYYWGDHIATYAYLVLDHLETRLYNDGTDLSRYEINKMKAKLEQYFAVPDMRRVIAHNNWGEYGHKHHVGVNLAVRELAVKYRKDVWMLGCNNGDFVDVTVPNGITWAYGSFNQPDLYTAIRTIYINNARWTWYTDVVPSGDHKFIKIVDGGVDKSNILTGASVDVSGPTQLEAGSYIFDGNDDYLTLKGNNYPSFTVALWIHPDQLKDMDISTMSEYPLSTTFDRTFSLSSTGHVSAMINDGSQKILTSTSTISSGAWTHIALTSNGSTMKLYINGTLERTMAAGTAITNYATPEFILGQATVTGSYFAGQINDVKLIDHALTDSEISGMVGPVYIINADAGTGGSINPSGNLKVHEKTSQTFEITPALGYKVSDVIVDGSSVGAQSTYTFYSITGDHTISAAFTPTPTYTITASSSSNGTISPSGSVILNMGSNQKFNMAAGSGYRISDVLVDGVSVGTVTSYTFSNITHNHSISVSYEAIPTYSIVSSAGTGGTISPSGTTMVLEGTSQSYTISPGTGYYTTDVRVDNVSVGAVSSYSFNNVTDTHTIAATFARITHTLTSSSGSGGTISPVGSLVINDGSSQTYTFTPNTGYQVSSVMVDNVSAGSPSSYTFSNVSANHTISVTFALIPYTLTSSAGSNGTISPSGTRTANWGTNQTYTIAPNTGYRISDVLVDNVSVGPLTSYTFSNITSNHSISVTFTPITFTITGSSGAGGSISPSGITTVNYGTNQTFTFTPNTGYRIVDVLADNVSAGAVSTYTFNNVLANHTISVTFTQIILSVTSSAGTGGSINPSGSSSVTYGSNATYTITPAYGYDIANVKVDNVSVGALSTYTFSNITSNHTISATFTNSSYSLTSSAGSGGSISPQGITRADHGTNMSYTITPAAGYRISDVLVDNISVGALSAYTFNNIVTNHTISATFAVITYTLGASSGQGGTITPAGNLVVNTGTSRTFTITPEAGYYISDVKVDNSSIGAVTTYTFNNITSNHIISAVFAHITFNITGSADTGGTINPAGVNAVNYKTDATYSIVPDAGYIINDVRADGISVGTVSSYTFYSVTSNHTLTATFKRITITITATGNSGGSISPEGVTTLPFGSSKDYIISPDQGYEIEDLLVDNLSVGPAGRYSFSGVVADHSISAVFKMITYTISSGASAGGAINPSGNVILPFAGDQNYTIAPDSTYKIEDVLVDGVSVGPVSNYSFDNVLGNHTITATFKIKNKYTISAFASTGGSINPAKASQVFEGSDQSYSIIPDKSFRIFAVIVDNHFIGTMTEYTFANLSSDHTISVIFSADIQTEAYPNPFSDHFDIKIISPDENLFDISISDNSSRIIYSRKKVPANTPYQINLNAAPGIYFVRISIQGNQISVMKLIKN
jgi:hypothetical protein